MSQGSNKSFVQQLKNTPKFDGLAIGALALNIYVVYSLTNLTNFQALMEPFASQEITIIQLSAAMAVLYSIEYFGDEGDSSHNSLMGQSSNSNEGLMAWISGFFENSKFSTVVDGLSIAAVFMGYQFISSEVTNVSLTEFSLKPEALALQLSALMMLNFGVVLLSDLAKKN